MNSIEELKKIPVSEWPRIACELNHWNIPLDIIHIKPKDYHLMDIHQKYLFIKPISVFIESEIGKEIVNRYHNRNTMTDEEHKLFWNDRDAYRLMQFKKDNPNTKTPDNVILFKMELIRKKILKLFTK